jgi:pimeloyl-ACP methyl ester carboxylesterase
MEPRLAACIAHGAQWNLHQRLCERGEDHGLALHMKWVFGCKSMAEVHKESTGFVLEGVLEKMRCPFLIVHGGHDVLGIAAANQVFEYAKAKGLDVTLRFVSAEETGAEHCQHDNPTIGQELMLDWLANRFGIDQRRLRFPAAL